MDKSQIVDAVNGFLASVTQTGTEFTEALSNKLPSTITDLFQVKSAPPPPKSTCFDIICDFIREHKVAIVVTATSCGIYYYCVRVGPTRKRKPTQNRRLARRAVNGGRSDVVLVAGSPKEPLVKLIAQDLNIRGYIVYVTATPTEEETIQKENSDDIHALQLTSYFEPNSITAGMNRMSRILDTPVSSFEGAIPHHLNLAGVIVIPDLFYPSGPLETISSSQWAQTVQSKIQMPINILSAGGLDLVRKYSSRVILVTPVIIGSLCPAFHAAESMVYGALSSLSLSLSRELVSQHIPFTHMRLGSFDKKQLKPLSVSYKEGTGTSSDRQVRNKVQADILSWPDSMRRLYGGPYKASAFHLRNQSRGTNLRTLYHSVYDVLNSSNPPRVLWVGKGSKLYDWLTNWLPESILTLLLEASE